MCGIVGYIGKRPAAPLLLEGLSKLEYRGYDSAGIALTQEGRLAVYKCAGRLQVLTEQISNEELPQTAGIGHTRWATHGKPSNDNSHPHVSENGKFAVVHNGIIENYAELRRQLQDKGIAFCSETDTETVAHLLQQNDCGDFLSTIQKTVAQLTGSYALGILSADHPDEIFAVRRASPLIIGLSRHGYFIASDIPAVLSHTRRFIALGDGEIARLRRDGVTLWDEQGNEIEKPVREVTWDISDAQKDGYDHFMIKEIMEQPDAVTATISPRITDKNEIRLDGFSLSHEELARIRRIYIVACGSAYHAGVVGKYVLEKLTRIPVETDIASEFRYRDPLADDTALVIIISQSGETADTLAALRKAKEKGARVLSIVNVVGSTIAAESDNVLYTRAGPEISVATTKAYSAQLVALYLVAMYLAEKVGRLSREETLSLISELKQLPDHIRSILGSAPQLRRMAQRYAYLDHAYFIGRNLDYGVALEASLKLKEISYIHSEAYAAGELKHGTISLIEEGTFVAALACSPETVEKTLSNVKEVKARGAEVLLVTTKEYRQLAEEADHVIYLPRIHPLLTASLEVVPLQLLGYYIALARKCDIDKPRNLAKSVTVE